MISVRVKGNFDATENFLNRIKKRSYVNSLQKYADMGTEALAKATPVDSGKTARSWVSKIYDFGDTIKIVWYNNNVNKWANIAILLQYGHATRNGGYVQGRDYINPAMQPIFDQIAQEAWAEVING